MTRKTSTWVLVVAFCLLFAGVGFAAAGKAKTKDAKKEDKNAKQEKVAVVNGAPITQKELDMEMGRYEKQMAMTGKTMDPGQRDQMKKEVLGGLIERELLLQESQKLGIKVSENEVSDQIASLKKRFPNEQEFMSALGKMGLNEAELKTQFGEDMAIRKMVDQEVASKVTVSEEEVKSFYDSHPDLFKTQEKVRASHILAKVDPKASSEDKAKARTKIEDAQKRIKSGEDFAAVAKELSDCPSNAKGGDLDFFQRGQMVGQFEEAAFAMKPGAVSDIVETQFGYHLVKVTDHKDAGAMSYDEIKERIAQHLKQEKMKQQLSQYVEQLKAKAAIETFIQ